MENIIKTYCGICESTCGMEVTVKDNKVIKIEGLKEHLRSKGDLCIKGAAARDILYAPDRLRTPLKKENGRWIEISWDEALEIITEKLSAIKDRYGAKSLAAYHGQTYVKNSLSMSFMKRFFTIFGSPNICSAASECFIPFLLGGITTFGNLAFADAENSRCVVIWGSDPFSSGNLVGGNLPRTLKIFNRLKEEGVRFIVIDPRTPVIGRLADLHLRVRPGTDGALALGMMKVIIDEDLYDKEYVDRYTSGFSQLKEMLEEYPLERIEKITLIPRGEIEKAARIFATTRPASIIPGNGVEHQTNTVQTIRAINILLSITGNIDVKGGNTFISPSLFVPESIEGIETPAEEPIGMKEHPMFVSMINQAQALVVIDKILKEKESPIKAFIVAGGAPIPQLANTNKVREALQKLEFIVVIDLFMTETAKYADVILPAAFFLERDELGTMPFNLQRKAVDGGQCWPDWKIWWELAKKMGYSKYFPWKGFEDAADSLLRSVELSYEELEKHPEGILKEIPPGNYLKKGFHTFSGKIEIYSHSLASNGYDALPIYQDPGESVLSMPHLAQDYPLTLITGARLPMYVHSQHRNIPSLRNLFPEPFLEINPETAKEYGIKDGDRVIVESLRGRVIIRAKLTEGIMSGVVHLPHGWIEYDCNQLTDHEKRDPISGFPGLKSSLCRVQKV